MRIVIVAKLIPKHAEKLRPDHVESNRIEPGGECQGRS